LQNHSYDHLWGVVDSFQGIKDNILAVSAEKASLKPIYGL